ncbi:MAG: hypothetical protein QE263_00160 [Vampirovibrionales bacterium]|nr:hypothetical protein [Vampirovibrionales bacterium]
MPVTQEVVKLIERTFPKAAAKAGGIKPAHIVDMREGKVAVEAMQETLKPLHKAAQESGKSLDTYILYGKDEFEALGVRAKASPEAMKDYEEVQRALSKGKKHKTTLVSEDGEKITSTVKQAGEDTIVFRTKFEFNDEKAAKSARRANTWNLLKKENFFKNW